MKITVWNGSRIENFIESPTLEAAQEFYPTAREWVPEDDLVWSAQFVAPEITVDVPASLLVDDPTTAQDEADPNFWARYLPTFARLFGK
jgi:hypothetical protein